jgi:hypothetical protein
MTPDDLRRLAEAATPGPWLADLQDDEPYWCAVVSSDARMLFYTQGGAVETERANARLAALAPDLALLCAEAGSIMRRNNVNTRAEQKWLAKLSELEAR